MKPCNISMIYLLGYIFYKEKEQATHMEDTENHNYISVRGAPENFPNKYLDSNLQKIFTILLNSSESLLIEMD